MKKNAGICLFLKKQKENLDGTSPVYLRLTLEGKRNEALISTGKNILPKLWKETRQLKITKKEELIRLRNELMRMRTEILTIVNKTHEQGIIVSAEEIKRRYLNPNEWEMDSKTLLDLVELHTSIFEKYVKAAKKRKSSRTKYNTVAKHLRSFLSEELKLSDIRLKALNYSFIEKFDIYLRLKCKLCNNTTVKYCQFLRAMITVGIKHEYLKIDPFSLYEGKLEEVETHYLNEEQINILENKQFVSERLNIVKDVFLMGVFTGYAPCDIANLRQENIIKHIDGQFWIFTSRQKTKIQSNVPLLPPALKIIEKYRNHERCRDGRIVPFSSNQKMNEYLKEIGELCGIPFPLHYYVSRHSFAMMCVNNGISLESTGKMMGHKRITQTQHYARILNGTVGLEMKKFSKKFQSKTILAKVG